MLITKFYRVTLVLGWVMVTQLVVKAQSSLPFLCRDTLFIQDPNPGFSHAERVESFAQVGSWIMYFPGDYCGHFFSSIHGLGYVGKMAYWTTWKNGKTSFAGTSVIGSFDTLAIGIGSASVQMSSVNDFDKYLINHWSLLLGKSLFARPRIATVAPVTRLSENEYRIWIPLVRRVRGEKKKGIVPDSKVIREFQDSPRIAEFSVNFAGNKWRLRKLNAFGYVKDDQSLDSARIAYQTVSFTSIDSSLAISHPSSHWVMFFGMDGQTKDSIYAKGNSMPDHFVRGMKAWTIEEYYASRAQSGQYSQAFFLPEQSRLVRTYKPPGMSADTLRQNFLQVIELETKKIWECEIEPTCRIIGVIDGKVVLNGHTVSREGKLLVPLYEIVRKE